MRAFCTVAVGWLVLAGCAPERPADVVFITLDTTRRDHLGAYGYGRGTTPNLDGFAAGAITFERAWSTSSWTLPAHASMFTGRHPTSHGAHRDAGANDVSLADQLRHPSYGRWRASRLAESEVTLAELLAERGYATGAFVGGPWLAEIFGLLQGYEHRDDDVASTVGRSAEDLTDAALAWASGVPASRPLHLLVNYFDPHSPFDPPAGFDDLPGVRIPLEVDQVRINAGMPLSAAQRTAAVDRYDGEIRFMDHHFGRLLEGLERLGRYDGALVVVVADHGDLFGEHGHMDHGRWLYEGILRVPLLVRFPNGRRAGAREQATVSVVDLLPLIASELGLSLPPGVEGLAVGARREAFAETRRDPFSVGAYGDAFDRDLVSAVRWPFKLIRSDRGDAELYRLDVDPAETRVLASEPVTRELAAALDRHQAAISPPTRHPAPVPSDPALAERLRELGYVE